MKRRRGLTLIEFLVVMGILVLIVAVVLPALQMARESARRSQCTNTCKQIGLGLANYENALSVFPPAQIIGTNNNDCVPTNPGNNDCNWQRASWTVLLIPYLDDRSLFNEFNFQLPYLGRCDYAGFAGSSNQGYNVNFLKGTVGFGQWADSPSDSGFAFRCPANPNFNTDRYINCYNCCMGGGPGGFNIGLGGTTSAYDLPLLSQKTEKYPEGDNPLSACYVSNTAQSCCPEPAPELGSSQLRVIWNNGIMHLNSDTSLKSITDGAANTVICGETLYVGLTRNYCGSSGPGTTKWGTPSSASWLWSSSTVNHANQMVLFNTAATWSPINSPFLDFTWAEALSRQGATGHRQIMAGFSSWHSGGANHIFADGSVRFINQTVDLSLYQTLGSKADGIAVAPGEL